MVELHAPWVLALPPAIGLALLWLLPSRRGLGMSHGASQPRMGSRWRVWLSEIPRAARFGALAALAWIAAAPYRTVLLPPTPGEGVALMVALDVSESMGEPGLGGRRKLDVAVEEVRRFAEGRDGDAIGLIAFAGEAVVRVPPTVDRAVFLRALEGLRVGEHGDGTAIGTAVGMAANRLRGVDARSRVLVLVSDGRSNAGALDPVTAARAAAALGQRIYVIEARGDAEPEPLLGQVALEGGGRHFPVSDRAGLDEAYREIDTLEPSRLPGRPRTAQVPASAGLLWAAAGLLAIERIVRASRFGRLG